MSHHEFSTVKLPAGLVHRVVLDLVRIGVWSEQQAATSRCVARRRQLGTVNLACRLAAEVIRDTLCVPVLLKSRAEDDASIRE